MPSTPALADVVFDPTRPSRRWLLVLSLLAHALVLAAALMAQLQPARIHVAPPRGVTIPCVLPPPAARPMVCRTWHTIGDSGPSCARYFQTPPEIVQFTCAALSPELRAALRRWPYRVDPCGGVSVGP